MNAVFPQRQKFVRRLFALGLAAALAVSACGTTDVSSGSPSVPSVDRVNVVSPTPDGSHPAGSTPTASPSPSPTAPAPSDLVTAFFYAWYGTPSHDGAWRHWNQLGHQPPGDIASSFYPADGPYSSRDPAVLARQMSELRSTGVGVIAVSWWGRGSWDDQTLDAIFAAAGNAGLKVAFHIEPYTGRTAQSIAGDIHAFLAKYGGSPTLLRVSRPTAASATPAPRAVFYIFAASQLPTGSLKTALDPIRGTSDDSIVLVHSPKARTALRDGADGVYTYDPLEADPSTFSSLVSDCRAANLLCSPSVSPGFDNTHAVTSGATLDRAGGGRYDSTWQAAIAARSEWVSIVSFNEWHEGTEIEPAQPYAASGRQYLSFEGAYGLTGAAAEPAYLERTAYWVARFAAGR